MAFSIILVISDGLEFGFMISLLWVHREPSGKRQVASLQLTGLQRIPLFTGPNF